MTSPFSGHPGESMPHPGAGGASGGGAAQVAMAELELFTAAGSEDPLQAFVEILITQGGKEGEELAADRGFGVDAADLGHAPVPGGDGQLGVDGIDAETGAVECALFDRDDGVSDFSFWPCSEDESFITEPNRS